MSRDIPRQALLLLDLQQTVALEEIQSRLPEPAEGEPGVLRVFRLLDRGIAAWPASRPPNPIEWQSWARHVTALVEELQAFRRQEPDREVQLYIAGDAALPLFVQLGQLLRDWPSPLGFIDARESSPAQKNWDEVQVLPLPSSAAGNPPRSRYFDQRELAGPTPELPKPGPVAFLVSNRGIPMSRESTSLGLQPGSESPHWLELGTKTFKLLSSGNVLDAQNELTEWFTRQLAVIRPESPATLLVHGTRLLGFLIGRAWPKKPVAIPHWVSHRFHPGLTLPLPDAPVRESGNQLETVRVCLVHVPPERAQRLNFVEELKRHILNIDTTSKFYLDIVDVQRVPAGKNLEETQREFVLGSDLIIAFLNPEFIASSINSLAKKRVLDDSVIPVKAYAVGPAEPWNELQLYPREGRPVHGLDSAEREKIWVDLAGHIQGRTQRIAAEKLQRRIMQDAYRGSVERPQSLQMATTVSEYLEALPKELATIPRLRCTWQERYDAWYGLVRLVDRLHPDKSIIARLNARSPAMEESIRRSYPSLPITVTRPEDPLGYFIEFLGDHDAAQWLYFGVIEFGPKARFPEYGLDEVDLLGCLRSLNPQLKPGQQQWLGATEIAYQAGCPSLLASLPLHHAPPLDELNQAIVLLKALRSGEALPPIDCDLAAVKSQMLLNVIGAQAWFRGEIRTASEAYRAAQQRAAIDEHSLSEWIAVLGQRFLTRFDSEMRRAVAGRDDGRFERQQRRLERESAVAQFSKKVDRLHTRAQLGLLERMQEMQADALPTFWQDSWHTEIRGLSLDQEELGQAPGMVGATVEFLTTAALLTPDAVYGTTRLEAIDLLCRYGHSSELKRRDSSRLLQGSKGEEPFTKILQPGRTASEWIARLSLVAQNLSQLPLALVLQTHEFYLRGFSSMQAGPVERVHYFHGKMYANASAISRQNNAIDNALLLCGLNQNSGAFLLELFRRLPNHGKVAILSHMDTLEQTGWFELQGVDNESIRELAKSIREFCVNGSERWLLTTTEKSPSWHHELQLHCIPLGLAPLLAALRSIGSTDDLRRDLGEFLRQILCAGLVRDYRRFLQSALLPHVLTALQDHSAQFGETEAESVIDIVFDQLAAPELDLDTLDGLSLLAQTQLGEKRELLTPAQLQRLWNLLLGREADIAKSVEQAGAASPLMWITAALLRQQSDELRQLGMRFLRSCPADPSALAAVAAMPTDFLDEYQVVIDRAIRHCLQGQPERDLPWFFAGANPPKRQLLDSESTESRGLIAVNYFLYFHPQNLLPKRWVSLALAQLFSRDKVCVNRALQVLDRALLKQRSVVNMDTALTGLAHVLGNAAVAALRENALRILVRHRARFEEEDEAGVRAVLAPFDPPRTIGTDWARRAGTAERARDSAAGDGLGG